MRIRWGRVVVAAISAEVGAIVALVALVALFGPKEAAAAQAYAERLGAWVGPIGGAVMCFIGGLWVARSAGHRGVMHGVLVGFVASLIDSALLIGMGAAFQFLFVASNLGKIVAGGLGGWVARGRASVSGDA